MEKQMTRKTNHNIILSFVEGIPEISISGNFIEISEPDLQKDLFNIMNGLSYRKALLMDIRGLKGRPGIGPTYDRVRYAPYYNLFEKVAIIDLIENYKYYSFHETTAHNAGHNILYFNDKEKAIIWLKGGAANLSGASHLTTDGKNSKGSGGNNIIASKIRREPNRNLTMKNL